MSELKRIDDGLSAAGRAALTELRAAEALPDAVRDRMWARLAAQTDVPSDMSGRTARGRSYLGAVIGLAIAAGLALALVSLGRGAQELAAGTGGAAAAYGAEAARSQPVQAGERGRPAVGEAAPVMAAPVAEPVARPREVVREVAREVARERRAQEEERGEVAVPEDRSTLAVETALLQRAHRAVAAGDGAGALADLEEHARGFAEGVLAREREALRVSALCVAGRVAEGEAAAAAFLKEHPESLLAERVRGACVRP